MVKNQFKKIVVGSLLFFTFGAALQSCGEPPKNIKLDVECSNCNVDGFNNEYHNSYAKNEEVKLKFYVSSDYKFTDDVEVTAINNNRKFVKDTDYTFKADDGIDMYRIFTFKITEDTKVVVNTIKNSDPVPVDDTVGVSALYKMDGGADCTLKNGINLTTTPSGGRVKKSQNTTIHFTYKAPVDFEDYHIENAQVKISEKIIDKASVNFDSTKSSGDIFIPGEFIVSDIVIVFYFKIVTTMRIYADNHSVEYGRVTSNTSLCEVDKGFTAKFSITEYVKGYSPENIMLLADNCSLVLRDQQDDTYSEVIGWYNVVESEDHQSFTISCTGEAIDATCKLLASRYKINKVEIVLNVSLVASSEGNRIIPISVGESNISDYLGIEKGSCYFDLKEAEDDYFNVNTTIIFHNKDTHDLDFSEKPNIEFWIIYFDGHTKTPVKLTDKLMETYSISEFVYNYPEDNSTICYISFKALKATASDMIYGFVFVIDPVEE